MELQREFTKRLNQSIALIKSPLEWDNIRAEQISLKQLYMSYILPFAAIPAIGMFVGSLGAGIVWSLVMAIATYIVSIVGIYITSLIVQKLAPSFNGTPSLVEATKLVAFSMAPSFLAGALNVLSIIPFFGFLVGLIQFLVAIYAVYLFYKGIGPLTSIPEDKRVLFLILVVIINIVIRVILSVIFIGTLVASLFAGAAATGAGSINFRG